MTPAPQPSREVTPRQHNKIMRSRLLSDRGNKTAGGTFDVITRDCPGCGKSQMRVDRATDRVGPIQWACPNCHRIDEEPGRPSGRELEVIKLLCEDKSSKEVASALGLAVKTVETHRANIMRKLKLHSVVGIVKWAVRNKIVEA